MYTPIINLYKHMYIVKHKDEFNIKIDMTMERITMNTAQRDNK